MKKSLRWNLPLLVLALFLVRLISITNPPLERGHNWRQCTCLMVARNRSEGLCDPRDPMVDENGGGVIGMEFPLLEMGHTAVAQLFGYTHWQGRLVNIIVSSMGLLFFGLLLRRLGRSDKESWLATLFLGLSIWFAFSRKTMPDTFCISLILMALYCALHWLEERRWWQLLSYTLLSTLALLSKIPAGIYLIWLLPLMAGHGEKCSRIWLCLCTLVPLGATYGWYFLWNPHLAELYGNWYNIGKPIGEGTLEIAQNIGLTLKHFYFDAFCGYTLFALSIFGLVMSVVKRERLLLWLTGLTLGVFIVYIFKSGFYFYHHNYYIIPFVPVMAWLAAYGLGQIPWRWMAVTLCIVGSVECVANQQHDFFSPKQEQYKMSLEPIVDQISAKEERIAVVSNGNPQLLYLAHRKGWLLSPEEASDTTLLRSLPDCRLLLLDKHDSAPPPPLPVAFEDDNFLIFRTM